jgi:hypothetical protein
MQTPTDIEFKAAGNALVRRGRRPMRVEGDYLRRESSKNGGSPAVRTFTSLKDPTADGPPFLEVCYAVFAGKYWRSLFQ